MIRVAPMPANVTNKAASKNVIICVIAVWVLMFSKDSDKYSYYQINYKKKAPILRVHFFAGGYMLCVI
jgi:hypothetical protein